MPGVCRRHSCSSLSLCKTTAALMFAKRDSTTRCIKEANLSHNLPSSIYIHSVEMLLFKLIHIPCMHTKGFCCCCCCYALKSSSSKKVIPCQQSCKSSTPQPSSNRVCIPCVFRAPYSSLVCACRCLRGTVSRVRFNSAAPISQVFVSIQG